MYVDDIYYTADEVAKLLKSSYRTVLRWIETGKLEASKPGGEWRISATALGKLLEKTKKEGQAASPKMPIERWTGDEREIICPACKSYICYPEDIKTIDLKYRQFCGACGQKLNWESEVEHDA